MYVYSERSCVDHFAVEMILLAFQQGDSNFVQLLEKYVYITAYFMHVWFRQSVIWTK